MPQRWNDCALLRREQIESGLDITFAKVFVPWYKDFISNEESRTILEVGAGTGHLALSLANLVDLYVAIEPSAGMHSVAVDVLGDSPALLSETTIEDLELDRFYDVVLSHLCVQTSDDFQRFIERMSRHVAPSGSLVFSIPHPAFYNDYKQLIPPDEYDYMTETHREVSFNVTLDPGRPITGVPYCHRPVSTYVRAVAACGFAVTAVEEMFPPPSIQKLYGEDWATPRYMVIVSRRYRR